MNPVDNPRAIALAVSTAVFVMQLVAFGSGADSEALSPQNCNDMTMPSSITVPPLAPNAPGLVPSPSESHSVSI